MDKLRLIVICCEILLRGKIVRIEATKWQDNMVLFFSPGEEAGENEPYVDSLSLDSRLIYLDCTCSSNYFSDFIWRLGCDLLVQE